MSYYPRFLKKKQVKVHNHCAKLKKKKNHETRMTDFDVHTKIKSSPRFTSQSAPPSLSKPKRKNRDEETTKQRRRT